MVREALRAMWMPQLVTGASEWRTGSGLTPFYPDELEWIRLQTLDRHLLCGLPVLAGAPLLS